MSKFSDLFPTMSHLEQPHTEDGKEWDVVYAEGDSKACIVCGDMTNWFSLSFQGPVCSEECDESIWGDYWDSLREHVL